MLSIHRLNSNITMAIIRLVHDLTAVDGFDMWPTLTNVSNLNTSSIDPLVTFSPRFEVPHNVDPLLHAAGLPHEPQG